MKTQSTRERDEELSVDYNGEVPATIHISAPVTSANGSILDNPDTVIPIFLTTTTTYDDDATDEEDDINSLEDGGDRRYPVRQRRKPLHFDDYVMNNVDICYKAAPRTYNEAMKSSCSEEWKKAMEAEMNSLKENDTFEIVRLPKDKKPVGGRWVYALKEALDGSDVFKARFVAKGFSQTYGIDYFSTFAPTTRMSTIRMVIQIAVNCDYLIHQMDVKSAYRNAPIDCDIFMEQPKGYEEFSPDGQKLVYKLRKSLYGLKQSASNWSDVPWPTKIRRGPICCSKQQPLSLYGHMRNYFAITTGWMMVGGHFLIHMPTTGPKFAIFMGF